MPVPLHRCTLPEDIEGHVDAVRKTSDAARFLGLHTHSLMQAICPSLEAGLPRGLRFNYRQQLVKLCYRTDPQVQYERYHRISENIARALGRMAEDRRTTRSEVQPLSSNHTDSVLAKYLMQHFQQHCALNVVYCYKHDPNVGLSSLRASMDRAGASNVAITYQDEDGDEAVSEAACFSEDGEQHRIPTTIGVRSYYEAARSPC